MTKPISRKMAVDCLLWLCGEPHAKTIVIHPVHGYAVNMFKCAICGEAILPSQLIQFDHIHAYVHGGAHVYQNLRPVHAECHKRKTKADIQANAKVKRILADKPSKRPMKNSGKKLVSHSNPWGKAFRQAIGSGGLK